MLEEWSISLLSVPRILTTFFCQGRVASPDPLVVEVAAGPLLLRQPVHGRPRFLGAAHVRRHRARLHSSADADRRLSLPARVHQAAAGKRTRHSVNSAVRLASNAARACWKSVFGASIDRIRNSRRALTWNPIYPTQYFSSLTSFPSHFLPFFCIILNCVYALSLLCPLGRFEPHV